MLSFDLRAGATRDGLLATWHSNVKPLNGTKSFWGDRAEFGSVA